jgi:hypothetical protein
MRYPKRIGGGVGSACLEEADEVRELGEDELYVRSEAEAETEPAEKQFDPETRFEPYLTSSPSPPAALLAVSIRSAQDKELREEETTKA